jgi:aminoglycoside 3-N-acetyltransferase
MCKKYTFTFEETVEALKKGGLKEGDTVWVFSSLGFLGRPEGAKTPEEICRFFHKAIREAIGKEGTIVVPTLSLIHI